MLTIINAIIIYWTLLFVLRLVGRRGPSLSTPFEIILLFMLGGMGMQAILGEDRSLTNALLGIFTIALMHILVASLKQWLPSFGRVVDGTPVLVYGTGQWHRERMRQLRLQEQDVMSAARQQGLERLEQVKYAFVERNGAVSIVRQEEKN